MGEIADLLKLFSRSTSNSVPAPFDRGDACRLCEDIPQRAFVPVAALFRDERDRYVRFGKQPLRLAHSDGEYLVVCSAVHYRNVLEVGETESAPAQRRAVDDHSVRTLEAQYRIRCHAFVVGVDRLDVPAALSSSGVDAPEASAPEAERSFEEVQYARGSPCHQYFLRSSSIFRSSLCPPKSS